MTDADIIGISLFITRARIRYESGSLHIGVDLRGGKSWVAVAVRVALLKFTKSLVISSFENTSHYFLISPLATEVK